MGAPVAAPTASSSDAERPNTNSVPGLHGTPHTVTGGRITSCPEESNIETRSPLMPSA